MESKISIEDIYYCNVSGEIKILVQIKNKGITYTGELSGREINSKMGAVLSRLTTCQICESKWLPEQLRKKTECPSCTGECS